MVALKSSPTMALTRPLSLMLPPWCVSTCPECAWYYRTRRAAQGNAAVSHSVCTGSMEPCAPRWLSAAPCTQWCGMSDVSTWLPYPLARQEGRTLVGDSLRLLIIPLHVAYFLL